MRLVHRIDCCGLQRYFVPCDFRDQDGTLISDCIVFDEPSVAYRWLLQTPKHARVRREITLEEQCTGNVNYRGSTRMTKEGIAV